MIPSTYPSQPYDPQPASDGQADSPALDRGRLADEWSEAGSVEEQRSKRVRAQPRSEQPLLPARSVAPPRFRGECASASLVATGLRGIFSGKRDQHVQMDILPDEGLRFTTTDASKSLQGCALVSNALFDVFEVDDESSDVMFRVNLAVLLDCLSMCSGP
jgi:hypothetical protein